MKVNRLVNELAKGYWAMSIESISIWTPIAEKILNGEKFSLKEENDESDTEALVSYFSPTGRRVSMDETGQVPAGTIAVVSMVGAIIKYGDWCTYGADEIVAVLEMNDNNPNIIGQILDIDGPGGSVSAIAPFVNFGLTKKKPVVGLLDMCCSAHLYAAVNCCDHLKASNTISATIGSIGVVLSFRDNKEFLEKNGIKFHEIYPDESEDKNLPFRLALEGKYEMIKKEMLSPMAIKFQENVKAKRPNLKENVPGLLTGKTFQAEAALEYGLIDTIGNMKSAMDLVMMLSELNRYK